MGLALGMLSGIIMLLIIVIISPYILNRIIKKFNFNNNTVKKHAIFWLVFILAYILISWLTGYLLNTENKDAIENTQLIVLAISFLLDIMAFILILKAVFNESIVKSVKASLLFALIIGVCSVIILILILIVFSNVASE